jgi:peptidoglycan/LPS O-acetylase OafA/YrhL
MNRKSSISFRFDSLDGLRGVAAFSVLIHHVYQQYYLKTTGDHVKLFDWFGGWGVSLFFVLSGFCIHSSQAIQRQNGLLGLNYRKFFLHRAFRIVPAYYVAVFFCLLVGFFRTTALIIPPKTICDVISHFLFIYNWMPWTFRSINSVFWTIAIEVQFYIFYALIYKWLNFRLGQLFLFIAVGLAWYGIASSLFFNGDPWRVVWQNIFITTFWSWYLGAILAEWMTRIRARDESGIERVFVKNEFVFILLIIVLNLFGAFVNPVLFKLHLMILFVPIGCALLIAGLAFTEDSSRVFSSAFKTLKWLGEISYSLYLLHPVGIAIALLVFSKHTFISPFFAVIFSFVLAILNYKLVEKPFMKLRKNLD